jgi:hypothetical protein
MLLAVTTAGRDRFVAVRNIPHVESSFIKEADSSVRGYAVPSL